MQALSVGGGGGRGGKGDGLDALGGSGSAGGTGGNVTVSIDAASKIATSGTQAFGLHAASVGGGGGDGGGSGGITALGGSGGTGGGGARVTITNDAEIGTTGDLATGIYALSLGGGGGSAHSTAGIEAIGGSGGGGGSGGPMTIDNSGVIRTTGDDADAVLAQSVGGGGGHGSSATSGGIGFSQAIGGQGGSGGFSNSVTYTDTGTAGRTISTKGDRSRGIFLQSVGGGGGDGGNSVSVSGGAPVNLSLGYSGSGGGGGDANWVQIINGTADIITKGDHSAAIHLQTVGGGGGNAGSAFTFTATPAAANVALGVGAKGGSGGDAGTVWMQQSGSLSTSGDYSPGLLAQSIGGGGGNGGNTISGNVAGVVNVAPSIGGSGGTGGNSGDVTIGGDGGIVTRGANAPGISAQAVGGGGGHGGATVAASGMGGVSANVSVGGNGGVAGDSGKVSLDWADNVTTGGDNSAAVLAQSVGGGGGSSGTTVSGALNSQVSATVAVGGQGNSGGTGGEVDVTLTGALATSGNISPGLMAQSVGGGGGHAGATLAGTGVSNTSANVTLGGRGGQGGNADSVTVAVSGVTTQGASSVAVEALSIGGSGGSSHITGAFSGEAAESASVAIGGKGGAGGNGGVVSVAVNGDLETAGHNAAAVSAMSVGGGGGNGSLTVAGSAAGGVPANVAVGGDGSVGGSGGAVTVETTNTSITTAGKHSDGILAASIGSSGGSAGYTLTGSGVSGGSAGVTVGGKGGSGGGAGTVKVTNGAAILTKGALANAIVAQSVAGGGGSSKGSIDVSALSMGAASVTIGGKGGAGGNAGDVTVTGSREAVLTTEGHHSAGILAQSLGGSGGNGGFAAEASFTASVPDVGVSGEAGISVGGAGGHGGTAGTVTVSQTASIATSDFASTGIIAQSVGGSGGNGGNVYTGNLSFGEDGSATANLDIGGKGGHGSTADTVSVTNGGAITTDGYYADGILAQSIGGNGGRGGTAYSVLTSIPGSNSMNLDVTIGGAGGSGQDAGAVTVDNTADITTAKGGSSGIIAMSVGGGGGRGGGAANLNLQPLPSGGGGDGESSLNANVSFAVGGKGGAGGNGEDVSITNTGTVSTTDVVSHGIYGISVGGGGGEGGAASAASYSFNGVCSALSGGAGYGCKASGGGEDSETTNVKVSLSLAIGGSGGAAGNSGDVDVGSDAAIVTKGDFSHGLVAHSHAGGGGNGGGGDIGIAAWTTNQTALAISALPGNFTFIPNFSNVSISIGGTGGAAGTGGTVTAGGSGSITTSGDHAFAIHAQSIGGGGGNGGAGAGGLWTDLLVGGRGSGGGNGGAVTVHQTGAIATSGEGGVGIFAQSVGGGGGTAGDIEKGFHNAWFDLNIGAGVGVQESPGAGGAGGAIAVTAGPITTTGIRAHGIIAQSVGGSGGIAGISGVAGSSAINSFAGGAGDAGDSGDVTVTTKGAINVSGQYAHGIFAQSAVGRLGSGDTSGDVTIDVNADITASGADGRSILAQAAGGSTAHTGKIAITVAEGATVATAADGAETIGLFGGNENTIVNHGTIRHAGTEADDYVIRTDGIALAIQNHGVIEGSVLGEGTTSVGNPVALANASGATFGMGGTVNLAPGGTLDNQGTISAGAAGTIGSSTLFGTLTQTSGGTVQVDYTPLGSGDEIMIEAGGTPTLAGRVLPNPVAAGRNGEKDSIVMLKSPMAIASGDLTVSNTSTVNYTLERSNTSSGSAIQLNYAVDYTPWNGTAPARAKVPVSLAGNITSNHTSFGDHVDALVGFRRRALRSREGGPVPVSERRESDMASDEPYPFVEFLALHLMRLEKVEDLVATYDRFAPGEIFASADAALFSALRFADGLNSCPSLDASNVAVFGEEGTCVWARAGGVARRGSTDGLVHGYDENVLALSGGGQFEFAPGWCGGVAVGYESFEATTDFAKLSDGSRFQAGAILKRELGATTLSASVAGGWSTADLQRQMFSVAGSTLAKAEIENTWLSAHARVSHRFDVTDSIYVKPWFDAGVEQVWQNAFRESGVGPYGLDVGSMSDTYLTLNPMLEFAMQFDVAGIAASASLSGGVLAIIDGNGRSAETRLTGMDDVGPIYTIKDDVDNFYGRLGAAVEAQINDRVTFKAGFDTLLGPNQQDYGGSARLSVLF